jgi:3-isopropylmalate/(R)-2-methylmalate dehydratase large subunit
MTITEKILADHAGRPEVEPGEFINARLDAVMANDGSMFAAIEVFRQVGAARVFDSSRVVAIPDHFTPNKDIPSAKKTGAMRDFVAQQGITNYFELGRGGIEHILMLEKGLALPGDLILGGDSHTCTYGAVGAFSTGVGSTDLGVALALGETWLKVPESVKLTYHGTLPKWVFGKDLILHTIGQIGIDGARYQAMEFDGEVISRLPISSRAAICNMAVEAGAKSGIIAPDQATLDYVSSRATRPYRVYFSDRDAVYGKSYDFDVSRLAPQVACPYSPGNVKPVDELGNVRIDQVFVGSCTNGWFDDLRLAASVLKGQKVHENVRMLVIPGTQEIYRKAIDEGILEVFVEAGAAVSTPCCGPCMGVHMGILGENEKAICTTNRNFVGRMGHETSEVYLSNPAVAAASAVLGRIASPEEVR